MTSTDLLGPCSQIPILEMRVVRDWPEGGQPHCRQQLHGACEGRRGGRVTVDPLQQLHSIRIIKFPFKKKYQVSKMF